MRVAPRFESRINIRMPNGPGLRLVRLGWCAARRSNGPFGKTLILILTLEGPLPRLAVRGDVGDVVARVEQGADLAVEDPRVGRVMHDRADDDAHLFQGAGLPGML